MKDMTKERKDDKRIEMIESIAECGMSKLLGENIDRGLKVEARDWKAECNEAAEKRNCCMEREKSIARFSMLYIASGWQGEQVAKAISSD